MNARPLLSSAFGFMFLLAAAGSAHAMSPGTATAGEHTRYALGADVIGQLPVGDFADVAGFGLGALLRYEHHIARSPLALTARGGYIYHLEESISGPFGSEVATQYSQVPLLAGVKYSLPGAPIYIGAEAGAVIGLVSSEMTGPGVDESDSDSETNFAWSAGAGYELGPVDIRLALYFADGANMNESMAVGVSFGYNFWGR